MAVVPPKTLTWLWTVLQREYRDPSRVYNDLVPVLSTYPTFAPRTDVYTSENGIPALLVHLNGTLPVDFRGTRYQFPVAIWLPHAYPSEAPILFVTPSADMVIRPGQFVSHADGRVYHPYLARWRESAGKSTIMEFLAILADVFAREPPVASKQQMTSSQTGTPPAPPRPPRPGGERSPTAGENSVPISRPISDRNGATSIADLQRQSRYAAPPPLPADPRTPTRPAPILVPSPVQYSEPRRSSGLQQNYTQQSVIPPQIMQISSPGPPGQQTMQPATVLPQHITQSSQQFRPLPRPQDYRSAQQIPVQQYGSMAGPGYAPQASSQPRFQPQIQKSPAKPQAPNLLDESPFDISLTNPTSTHLPKPDLPPNPERQQILQTLSQVLSQTVQAQIVQNESALPALRSQHNALQQAQQILTSELEQLKVLQSQLQSNITALTTTLTAADTTISNARSKTNSIPKIDDLIIPPTVVARQLYDNVAEQRACEAAIQALDEAFVRGNVGSEVWSRLMRGLGRDEFRRKWMVRRVATGMGLDMDVI